MHKKLSDRVVPALPVPTAGRYDCWDQMLSAFGVRVSATGSRTWMVTVRRNGATSSSRITLGRFPMMNTATARAAAREQLSGAAAATPARGRTFKHYVDRFLDHGRDRRGQPVRASTRRHYRFILNQVAVSLHARPIAKITRTDIAELLHDVARTRGDATAALARGVLGRCFGWMIESGVLENNPVTRSPIYSAGTGSRVLTDDEIRAIWGTEGPFGSILRLLLLLGARRAEIGGMKWSELVSDIWVLPAERAKNHFELRLPLPATAIAEINAQPHILGQDCVFGRGSTVGFTDWSGCKTRLDQRLGFARPWRLHDCRRTVRTRLHQLGIPPNVVTRVLNHDVSEVSRTYDRHDYEPEMRKALRRWERELLRIVRGQ